jgi:hypothetical protein
MEWATHGGGTAMMRSGQFTKYFRIALVVMMRLKRIFDGNSERLKRANAFFCLKGHSLDASSEVPESLNAFSTSVLFHK